MVHIHMQYAVIPEGIHAIGNAYDNADHKRNQKRRQIRPLIRFLFAKSQIVQLWFPCIKYIIVLQLLIRQKLILSFLFLCICIFNQGCRQNRITLL